MGPMDLFLNSSSEAESRKNPGPLCGTCNINDSRCESCLAEQQKILDAVDEAQDFEQAINELNNNPAAASEKISSQNARCAARPLKRA